MLSHILQEVFPLIQQTAPTLAGALGNSISAATPWALYLLSKAFGIDVTKVQDLPGAIKNDPNHESKLIELENSFSNWFMTKSQNTRITSAEMNIKLTFDNTSLAQP